MNKYIGAMILGAILSMGGAIYAQAANAPHDANHVPVVLGLSSFDGVTTIPIGANASSTAVLVSYPACKTITQSQVAINSTASTFVIGTSTNRAWLRIEQPVNATNTVALSFGAPVVAPAGFYLTPATSTNPVPYIDLGLTVPFDYNGEVDASTSASGAVVLVTQCSY